MRVPLGLVSEDVDHIEDIDFGKDRRDVRTGRGLFIGSGREALLKLISALDIWLCSCVLR